MRTRPQLNHHGRSIIGRATHISVWRGDRTIFLLTNGTHDFLQRMTGLMTVTCNYVQQVFLHFTDVYFATLCIASPTLKSHLACKSWISTRSEVLNRFWNHVLQRCHLRQPSPSNTSGFVVWCSMIDGVLSSSLACHTAHLGCRAPLPRPLVFCIRFPNHVR